MGRAESLHFEGRPGTAKVLCITLILGHFATWQLYSVKFLKASAREATKPHGLLGSLTPGDISTANWPCHFAKSL